LRDEPTLAHLAIGSQQSHLDIKRELTPGTTGFAYAKATLLNPRSFPAQSNLRSDAPTQPAGFSLRAFPEFSNFKSEIPLPITLPALRTSAEAPKHPRDAQLNGAAPSFHLEHLAGA